MVYVEHGPKNQLGTFIDKIWYCKADNLTTTCLTIPSAHHELVFNFSENYTVKGIGDLAFAIKNPLVWVNGLQTKAYFSYSAGKHEMLGVLFKANGLKAFIKYHASDFSNDFVDATLVFGSSIQGLAEQIQNVPQVTAKISLIENFLLTNHFEANCPRYLPYSLRRLSEILVARGSISNVCDEISISNKSLIGAFKKYVGITPVKYSHLQSINKSLLLLSKAPGQPLTQLAYELNFYDQSHFIKLFKSITSLTPSQYSTLITNGKIDKSSPNFIFLEG